MSLTVIFRRYGLPSYIDPSQPGEDQLNVSVAGTPVALLGIATVDTGILNNNTTECNLTVEGSEVALNGATGTRHGGGPHRAGVYTAVGSGKLSVNGQRVVVSGDLATCGHLVVNLPNKLNVASVLA